jgi:hypothetical protein
MTITSIERMRSFADVAVEDNLAAHRSSGCARQRRSAARPEVIGIDVARSYVLEPVA